MFKHLRKVLLQKTAEEELVRDRECALALKTADDVDEKRGEIDDDDVSSCVEEPRISGLTNVKNFNQLLSSFVLDCDIGHLSQADAKFPLHYAVRNKNHALLRGLLENEVWQWHVESVAAGIKGLRPIHIAAEINDVISFKILLEHGADPHARQTDFYGLQAVHIAAAKGSIGILRFLTTEIFSHDTKSFIIATDFQGSTALHWAVLGHYPLCVKLLLERGSSCDCRQHKGPQATPVHLACIQCSLEILMLMDTIRPDEFQRSLHIQDAQGCTPLHRATVLDNPELSEYLLDKGAPLDKLDNEGRSCIILSAIREAWKAGAVLLKWGVNPFDCDPVFLRTTAHHAAMVGANPLACSVLVEMMRVHPEWVPRVDILDGFGYTALQYAAGYGHISSFNGLLTIGAKIDIRNGKDKTVLHYAAKYGQLEIVKTILSAEIAPTILNAMDHRGRSALHLASSHGHHEVVELLLSKGAFPFRDDSGKSPFHMASSNNYHQIMGSIISTFALVLNDADKDGSSALHLAAGNDAAESVQYLLAIGALVTEDSYGRTPMDLAIFHKHEKTALAFVNSNAWKEIVMHPSRAYGNVVLGLITHLPDVMKRCLDRCVTKSTHSKPVDCYVAYDFSILNPAVDATIGYKQRKVPISTLKVMAKHGRSELLSHPVCTTLLERKWTSYGMYCSGLIMASNLVFVALLSYIVISAVTSDLRPHLLRKSYENIQRNFPEAINGSKASAFAELYRMGHFPKTPPFKDTPSLMVLGIALIIIFFKELAELRSEGHRYFLEWMNYLEVMLFITCGAFVFCFYQDDRTGEIGPLTYQMGAVAVFLAWFNLLRFCRPFGTFGIYSFMFFCILKTLIQVSFFFFLLTAAFTAAFFTVFQTHLFPNSTEYYLLNPDVEPADLKTAHTTVYTSALRIGAMTIGDLESLDNFMYPMLEGKLEYPFLSFIFYMGFLMLMPILLNNLLTGLAIGDMAAIQANAVSLRLEMQVYLHESLERLFPTKLLNKIQKGTQYHRVYPGRRSDFKTWLAKWMQSTVGKPSSTQGVNELEECLKVRDDYNKNRGIKKLSSRIKQMESAAAEQKAMLTQILNRLDKLTFSDDDSDTYSAANIAERARKRSERTEEDRRHVSRMRGQARKALSGTYSSQI